jgi:rare lipoprotein A (peptidoglycan hydrolase)
MKKYLPYCLLSLSVAAITFIVLISIFGSKSEIIHPLQDEKNNVRLNKEIELNKNENDSNSRKPIPSPSAKPASPSNLRESNNHVVTASFYTTEYCKRFNPSCRTASGDIFTDEGFTAACSYDFELGTEVLLTSETGSVTVRCNDRGSFSQKYGRTFDLTPTAFSRLAPLSKGVVTLTYQIIK